MQEERGRKRPFVIGVAGGTASGKVSKSCEEWEGLDLFGYGGMVT